MAIRFIWHDLMTTDAPRAKAFYAELFGWKTKDLGFGPWKYTLFSDHGVNVAGLLRLDAKLGVPSHWMPYVDVTDVDATCKQVKALGGAIAVKPTSLPFIGRFAVAGDPQKAWFSPFKPKNAIPEQLPAPGHFAWDLLITEDPVAARTFYEKLFGASDDRFATRPAAAAHPNMWRSYVQVTDRAATLARAQALGATPSEDGFVDPTGAPLGLK